MFNLHVLGCWGAYPVAGEATAGYLIETDGGKVLIDCGSGVLAQLERHCQVTDLAAVIITHHHHDHIADLGALGYAALLGGLAGTRQQPLPVYLPELPDSLSEFYAMDPWLEFHAIHEGTELSILGMNVTFAPTLHPAECYAIRIEHNAGVFVYSADSACCASLVQHAHAADLFLCEASMYRSQVEAAERAGHLTSEQCGRLAAEAGVKRLAITHFPHYGDLRVLRQEVEQAFGKPVELVSVQTVLSF